MGKKISVMLVDDNKIDLFVHNEFINQMNIAHTVLEFLSATEALTYLQDNEVTKWPNIILLDIHMPIMNGFDFLEKYVYLPISKRELCKVIIVSSSLDNGDILRAKENSNVLKLLEKPLNTTKLRQLLETEHVI